MEQLSLFFSKIKELDFWGRLFKWSSIRSLSYDAFEEFKSMEYRLNSTKSELEELRNSLTKATAEKEGSFEKVQDLEKQILRKDGQIDTQVIKTDELNLKISNQQIELSKFRSIEEERMKEYEKKVGQIEQVKTDLDNERSRLQDERVQEKENQFLRMKSQWVEHQTSVEQTIKGLSQKHQIKYLEKVPFKGSPDNTVEICNEYIIFDSKSPSNDDLINFPKYIRAQTESVKKYINQDSVKKDIFLVIPSNTIATFSQTTYNMGDYNVYIITKDSLEPVLLSLKKLEEYEFANQLSPDERDNICRVLGKFAHTTKRKIQIDQYFATQFINLLVKCKDDLPTEILEQVIEFEKAERLNPPSEKRTKQILTKELSDKHDSINAEAQIRQIEIPSDFDQVKLL